LPIYEFICKKCGENYDEFLKFDPTGKYKTVKCPQCNSTKKEHTMSVPSFVFGDPVGTDKWTSDTQGHDYRFKHSQPAVRKQRERAEKASNVGPNPYNKIDDINFGDNFGDVK